MKYNDCGPAFPGEEFSHFAVDPSTSKETPVFVPRAGMSLRDYFAVHATEEDILHQPDAKTRQQARYMHADAMLKAREE